MDRVSKKQRSWNMSRIRSTNTKPELAVMRELKRRKIYFAPHVVTITGKPDIVFRKKKVAVFIDSDFWHGHPKRFTMPKTNRKYWHKKISNNKQRDKEVNKRLKKEGWKILRVWEYEVNHDINRSINKILKLID